MAVILMPQKRGVRDFRRHQDYSQEKYMSPLITSL